MSDETTLTAVPIVMAVFGLVATVLTILAEFLLRRHEERRKQKKEMGWK